MNTIISRQPTEGARMADMTAASSDRAGAGRLRAGGGVTGAAAAWHGVGNAPAWPFVAAADGDDGAARRLRDAAERAARRPEGRIGLVLHLSRFPPPAPRPHHRRVARALLEDAAQRYEGQVFALRNGDLALIGSICAPVLALPEILGRLLRGVVPDPAGMVSLWPLAQKSAELLNYAAERLADRAAAVPDPKHEATPVSPLAIGTVLAALDRGDPPAGTAPRWTLRRWIAMLPGYGTADAELRPIFQEIGFAALPHSDDGAGIAQDSCLAAHLAGELDGRLLALLTAARGSGGVLDVTAPGRVPALLALTPATMAGADFAALARCAHAAGRPLAVAVGFADACADTAAFAVARRLSAELGCRLVLDGVSGHALRLTRPWLLGTELLRLDWSPQLPALPPAGQAQLGAALLAVGPSRIVLNHVGDEAALRWGLAHGIRRFQGSHVEAMLAAARLRACPDATACTLGQCAARGTATGPGGRRDCRRPVLLDAGAPLG
jgi:hypothetical protein